MFKNKKITDYDQFIGKWAVTFNNEQVSIEFHEQGRLTYITFAVFKFKERSCAL